VTFLLDPSKVRELAKPSHARCHGNGIVGRHVASNTLIVCRCVWRALKGKGVEPLDAAAVQKAIGREEAKAG